MAPMMSLLRIKTRNRIKGIAREPFAARILGLRASRHLCAASRRLRPGGSRTWNGIGDHSRTDYLDRPAPHHAPGGGRPGAHVGLRSAALPDR